MVTFEVQLADLEFLSPHDLSGELSAAEILAVIREQFDFLTGDVQMEISERVATIQCEGASAQAQAEARRLFGKAAKRARSGEFQKAKDIYGRVLELDPALPEAHRELAMALCDAMSGRLSTALRTRARRVTRAQPWGEVVLPRVLRKARGA